MPQPVEWTCQHSLPALHGNEVHVWRTRLMTEASTLSRLGRYLSADERQRADRFHFERDRRRFIVARGSLRAILAWYLDLQPEDITFCYGAQSKPALAHPADGKRLAFNLSHSDDLAICAVGWDRNIGIDLEKIRGDLATREIAQRYFSPREVQSLMELPADLRSEGFFTCWTRKEAYIKARGEGLSIPLDSFDVTLDPRDSARFVRGTDPSWQVTAFTAEAGFPAALVYDGPPARVRFLTYDPAQPIIPQGHRSAADQPR
jgi:4'-phosphopantetheinyl transferase